MGVGRGGAGGPFLLLDFRNFRKKGFLSFEWEKTDFTKFDPLEKSPSAPAWKNSSDAHDGEYTAEGPSLRKARYSAHRQSFHKLHLLV